MILKCNACGRSDDLSPLRIGRKHGSCGFGGKWLEVERPGLQKRLERDGSSKSDRRRRTRNSK